MEPIAINGRSIGGFNGLPDLRPLSFALFGPGLECGGPTIGHLVALVLAGLALLLLSAVIRSPFGTVFRGIRSDEERIALPGSAVGLWKAGAFAISGATAAPAGALLAGQFSVVSPPVIGCAMSTEILIPAALSEPVGKVSLRVIGILFIIGIVPMPHGLPGALSGLPRPRRLPGRDKEADATAAPPDPPSPERRGADGCAGAAQGRDGPHPGADAMNVPWWVCTASERSHRKGRPHHHGRPMATNRARCAGLLPESPEKPVRGAPLKAARGQPRDTP